jgi:uncharacterized protein (DUF2267 family)
MSKTGLESIDHTVKLTHTWINDLDNMLGWKDKHRSYQLLRSVLQALRDLLPINESADFAAQLPILVRGIYYEHWRPATTPVKTRSKSDFLARIDREFVGNPITYTAEAVSITFQFLSTKIAAGEIEDVRRSLPADLRGLWNLSSAAA